MLFFLRSLPVSSLALIALLLPACDYHTHRSPTEPTFLSTVDVFVRNDSGSSFWVSTAQTRIEAEEIPPGHLVKLLSLHTPSRGSFPILQPEPPSKWYFVRAMVQFELLSVPAAHSNPVTVTLTVTSGPSSTYLVQSDHPEVLKITSVDPIRS